MVGRPLRMDWRPEDSSEALRGAYLAERDIVSRTRLHGLWLMRTGLPLGQVASLLGVHYRTVQTWAAWYRKGGVKEVLSHRKGGKGHPAFLSEDQENELIEQLESDRLRSVGEVRLWIESSYGVSYKHSSVYSLLERLGVSPRLLRIRGAPKSLYRSRGRGTVA